MFRYAAFSPLAAVAAYQPISNSPKRKNSINLVPSFANETNDDVSVSEGESRRDFQLLSQLTWSALGSHKQKHELVLISFNWSRHVVSRLTLIPTQINFDIFNKKAERASGSKVSRSVDSLRARLRSASGKSFISINLSAVASTLLRFLLSLLVRSQFNSTSTRGGKSLI